MIRCSSATLTQAVGYGSLGAFSVQLVNCVFVPCQSFDRVQWWLKQHMRRGSPAYYQYLQLLDAPVCSWYLRLVDVPSTLTNGDQMFYAFMTGQNKTLSLSPLSTSSLCSNSQAREVRIYVSTTFVQIAEKQHH